MATKHENEHETVERTGRANHVTAAASGREHDAPVASAVIPRTPEEEAQMAASSVGAQIILDYNGSGSLGARGGAGATMEENKAAYEAHMVALGLDPAAPSGPPTAPDPAGAVRALGAPVGRATRISSLAAGIITGDPAPPAGGGAGARPTPPSPPSPRRPTH